MLHGWTPYTREEKGSHIKMKKKGCRPIIIPHGELKRGTERNILKQPIYWHYGIVKKGS
ncbi:type II toxin-antitoxin system HicA family toxin [Globicatella sanguinis]